MSPKSPQYRTLPHLQHGIDGSHHGVHTMMKADTIMLADSGLPPEPRTCMIAHYGGLGCEEAAWSRLARPAESLAHDDCCDGDGHTDGHTAQKQQRRSTSLPDGQVPNLPSTAGHLPAGLSQPCQCPPSQAQAPVTVDSAPSVCHEPECRSVQQPGPPGSGGGQAGQWEGCPVASRTGTPCRRIQVNFKISCPGVASLSLESAALAAAAASRAAAARFKFKFRIPANFAHDSESQAQTG